MQGAEEKGRGHSTIAPQLPRWSQRCSWGRSGSTPSGHTPQGHGLRSTHGRITTLDWPSSRWSLPLWSILFWGHLSAEAPDYPEPPLRTPGQPLEVPSRDCVSTLLPPACPPSHQQPLTASLREDHAAKCLSSLERALWLSTALEDPKSCGFKFKDEDSLSGI